MKTRAEKILYWSPRGLSVLLILFLSMFALDVFNEGVGISEIFFALMMHLIPTLCLVVALCVAWRWEFIGACIFIFLALFLLLTSRGEAWFISGPLLLIGVLFLLNWKYLRQTEK
ncbi:DUF7670 domain-containing protein [Desulfospira joergensenii]|uniref:DUF7670 domain-containing protein n=1 Tax=Desulfospira joergensenii TaxID=53329 RepID=UPI0003B5ACF5